MNLETECYKRLKEFLDGENVKYNQKGLSWSIGHKFYWLELRVNGY